MESLTGKVVCITGASAGIGAACAEEFARLGCNLLLVARRKDRIDEIAARLGESYSIKTHTLQIDVRNWQHVETAISSLDDEWRSLDILVNNAGLARGLAKLHEGNVEDWDEMIDTNIKGVLYFTRAVLPLMVERNSGHIINIGSIAGHQTYPMGNVYSATKFAVAGLTRGLRMDILGTAIRVTSVDPGLVETEFSQVRFHGDKERASKTYLGMTPLTPRDVAEAVVFCATRPLHVNIGELQLTPTDQATVTMVHRRNS
ncbi:MAG: SDR family NAD(P)-dependent oxidoreductase [Bacteroidetes bacterium]|nr:SDR family NAD(P)-dependent oxidoreductase [Bacteroidota bacterium]MCW5896569.1 SDR family NAD(P)-dependent oxidoreductase [Bacteroidota bacterium]